MVYIAENVDQLFLSKGACQDLGVVSMGFPRIADHQTGRAMETRKQANSKVNEMSVDSNVEAIEDEFDNDNFVTQEHRENETVGVRFSRIYTDFFNMEEETGTQDEYEDKGEKYDGKGRKLAPCGCLLRELPPPLRNELLFKVCVANIAKFETWIMFI